MSYVKIKAVGDLVWNHNEKNWDHKGRTQIVRIIVSSTSEFIKSLQFQYFENGQLETTEIIGNPNFNGSKLRTITFQGKGEYVKKVEGLLSDDCNGSIEKLRIHTNRNKYTIFQAENPSTMDIKERFSFEFEGENKFGGFHGVYNSEGLISIGAYFIRPTDLSAGYV